MNKIIYIRAECNNDEYRTPIIPIHVKILINNGFNIYIQASASRIYADSDYEKQGAIITTKLWYDDLFKEALIIGLKEIPNLDKLNNHTHLYFSHSFKNQSNSNIILNAFLKSSSIIYDFEYFLNNNNVRLISFGFYAGIVGGILGLKQYLNILSNLTPYKNRDELLGNLNDYIFDNCNIGIIGLNGNCGNGVKNILDYLQVSYTEINKCDDKSNLMRFDILFNCIKLDISSSEVWFDDQTIFNKRITIVDISCDYLKSNNPIKLYNKCTTWDNPVYKYNDIVDIIAIDNLPSLLPKESSDYFSLKCIELILDKNNDTYNYWKNNINSYLDILNLYKKK